MSLDFSIEVVKPVVVFDSNITHNLSKMANELGVYKFIWEAEENNYLASDLIAPLEMAISLLEENSEKYSIFDSPNGWGTTTQFLGFLEEVLDACKEYPTGSIIVSK